MLKELLREFIKEQVFQNYLSLAGFTGGMNISKPRDKHMPPVGGTLGDEIPEEEDEEEFEG